MKNPIHHFRLSHASRASLVAFAGFFMFFGVAFADSDNFDSYSVGDLNGQGGWVAESSVDVTNSMSQSSPNSVDFNTSFHNATLDIEDTYNGSVSGYIYIGNSNGNNTISTGIELESDIEGTLTGLAVRTNGLVAVQGGFNVGSASDAQNEIQNASVDNQWNFMKIDWFGDDTEVCYVFTVNTTSSTGTYCINAGGNIAVGTISLEANTHSSQIPYIDTLSWETDIAPDDTRTRIINVLPPDGEVYATSTESIGFGANVYINPADFVEGMYLEVQYSKQDNTWATGALFAWQRLTGSYSKEFPIETSGELALIESIDLPEAEGVYLVTAEIKTPRLLMPDIILRSNGGKFTVGAPTAIDEQIQIQEDWINDETLFNFPDECSFADLGGCLRGVMTWVFMPTPSSIERFKSLSTTAQTKFPFAYAYDLGDIRNEMFGSEQTASGTISTTIMGQPFTFISEDMMTEVPFAGTIQMALSWILWIMTCTLVYRRILSMHDNNTQTV